MKKILLGVGAISAVCAPVALAISCDKDTPWDGILTPDMLINDGEIQAGEDPITELGHRIVSPDGHINWDLLPGDIIEMQSGIPYATIDDGNPQTVYDETLVIESINFPNPCHLKVIGDRAFMNWKVRTIVIPNTVTTIGREAFQAEPNHGETTTLYIPDSVTSIGDNAFNETMVNSPNTNVRLPQKFNNPTEIARIFGNVTVKESTWNGVVTINYTSA